MESDDKSARDTSKDDKDLENLIGQVLDLQIKYSAPKTPRQIISHILCSYKLKVTSRNRVPIRLSKAKYDTMGVLKLLTNREKTEDSWRELLFKREYTELFSTVWEYDSMSKGIHGAVLSVIECIYHMGLDLVGPTDMPVCDIDFFVHESDKNSPLFNPIGSIDFLCYDPVQQTYVICDIKTVSYNPQTKMPLERIVLKQKTAMQMSFYATLLERMSEKAKCSIRVGYFVIVAYDPQHKKIMAWRIKRNDNKWIRGYGIEEKWHPILQSKAIIEDPRE